jgi:CHAD domain-containing protein
MAFRFEKSRTVAESVPRIVRKQAEKAAEGLRAGSHFAEGVHVARTSLKRLRGLLRLLEPELGSRYAEEEKRLRKLQRELGPLRDAQVLVATFDEHFRPKRARSKQKTGLTQELRAVRTALEARALSERLDTAATARVEAARSEFEKLRRRAERYTPSRGKRGGGFRALSEGLEATYQRAQRSRDAAYAAGTSEAFHDFRKAVKYHGHHLKLLGALSPAELGARLRDAEALGDLLGKDHDLAVLADALETLAGEFADERRFRAAVTSIHDEQRRLRKRAKPLGERLFAEPPADFRRMLREFFKMWRKSPEREDGEVGA